MQALKTLYNKLVTCLKTNPKTLLASAGNLGASGGLGLALVAVLTHFGVALPDWAIYLISGVASALVAILVEMGVISAGWETAAAKAIRVEAETLAKEQAKIEAEAKAQIKADEKAKAEQEKAQAKEQAKIEADAKAQLLADEKAKAEKEYQAKVNAKIMAIKLEQLKNANK